MKFMKWSSAEWRTCFIIVFEILISLRLLPLPGKAAPKNLPEAQLVSHPYNVCSCSHPVQTSFQLWCGHCDVIWAFFPTVWTDQVRYFSPQKIFSVWLLINTIWVFGAGVPPGQKGSGMDFYGLKKISNCGMPVSNSEYKEMWDFNTKWHFCDGETKMSRLFKMGKPEDLKQWSDSSPNMLCLSIEFISHRIFLLLLPELVTLLICHKPVKHEQGTTWTHEKPHY